MDWVAKLEQLNQRERDDFARIVNRLLASTFLTKQQEASRRDYYFVERNEALIAGYLKVIGWELIVDRSYGLVQASGLQAGNRLQLRLIDSVLLLLLRLIYEERRKQLTLTAEVVCQVQDLHDKAAQLRVRERAVIEKKVLKEAVALFRRYSLVEQLDDDVTDPQCRLLLLPTLLFAVKLDGIQELQDRLVAYAEGGESAEVDDRDPVD